MTVIVDKARLIGAFAPRAYSRYNLPVRSEEIAKRYQSLRIEGHAPHEAWAQIKQEFLSASTAKDPQQAWKSASGTALERIVEAEFQRQLEESADDRLKVQRWKDIRNDLVKRILSEPLWVRGELREPYPAESQVDLVACEYAEGKPVRVLAVYSCKASLRERFQQDLYWAEKFRGRGIRFCFITLDNDRRLSKAAVSGELDTKEAKMSVALYDRVYLLTDESIQHYTRVFRPIDCLVEDLKLWLQAG